MTGGILKVGAILGLLLGSAGSSFADDPTGALLQQRGLAPRYPGPGPLPAYTEGAFASKACTPSPRSTGIGASETGRTDRATIPNSNARSRAPRGF